MRKTNTWKVYVDSSQFELINRIVSENTDTIQFNLLEAMYADGSVEIDPITNDAYCELGDIIYVCSFFTDVDVEYL